MLRRVLLVEDHDSLRRLLGNFLSDNFDVVGAKNGLEAISWLSTGVVPDVIITDNDMPEIDGANLLRQLRCTGLWSNIPVVVMGEVEDIEQESERYQSLGAQAFFNRPFSPIALQEKLLQIVSPT
jgi:two-component system, chemotaxis family, chemotaxis protein CheY